MLTKNAYALMFGLMNKRTYVSMTSVTGERVVSVSIGNVNTFDTFRSNNVYDGVPHSSGLHFGTGDTAPDVNDYKLSGDLITNMTYANTEVSMGQTDEYTELQATVAVTNNSGNSVTIKEIGLFGYNSSGVIAFLLDRVVLATPITIPAGATKSITYNLRHTY